MPIKVSDIGSNLNENIQHAADTIGRSPHRRKVFEAIYRGKTKVKTVSDLIKMTGLSRVRVLQEGGKLSGNQIVEKTKKDNETAYRKDETLTHHKRRILSLVDDPSKAAKYPTKQHPSVKSTTYKIVVPGKRPRVKPVTVDEIDSFHKIRKFTNIDSSLGLDKMLESKLKSGLKKIIGETHTFKDWGGEKNDLYTNKIRYKSKRRTVAFALKGKATKGSLTPNKMGRNGDQISRLFTSSAEMFFVVYHGKIDESIVSQLEAFSLAKSMIGTTIYYGVIDGDDLNRLYQAYKACF